MRCLIYIFFQTVFKRNYDITFNFKNNFFYLPQVKTSTNQIILNSLDLNIRSAEYQSASGTVYAPTNVLLSVEEEHLTLVFAEQLPVGEGLLRLVFTGEINDKMKGFYRSKYVR